MDDPVVRRGPYRGRGQPVFIVTGQVDQRARREEVIPWLRQLGLRADEAKRGAAMCDSMPDASLGDRVRFALSGLARERFPRATNAS